MKTTVEPPCLVRHLGLGWVKVSNLPDYSGEGEWAYESAYKGLRVACGYNDGGPVAWVGHATRDRWVDSVACDGSFEDGARRALSLADELLLSKCPAFIVGFQNLNQPQHKTNVKLEIGQRYRTRNGLVTEPLVQSHNGTNYKFQSRMKEPEYPDPSIRAWLEDGSYLIPGAHHRLDLIDLFSTT